MRGGWTIGGTLEDLWVDIRPGGFSIVYYVGMVADLEITAPDGTRSRQTLRLFNAQLGSAQSFGSPVARLLLQGSQETLARLNATVLKAPLLPAAHRMMAEIASKGMTDREVIAHAVGLTGDPAGISVFLDAISRSKEEDERCLAIESLGQIGDPAGIAPLRERFRTEREDARWSILKALGYIGTPEALAFVKSAGLQDEDAACKALSRDVLGAGFAP